VRRNLSPDQKREALARKKAVAFKLRQEDAKYWTQQRVADELGVARQTVSSWFTPNAKAGNRRSPSKQKTSKGPDAKVKLSPEAKKEAAARVIAAAEHATDSRVVDAPDVLPRQAGARDATPASQAQPSGIVVDAAATRNAPEPMKGLER
jgi:hypothetical protein